MDLAQLAESHASTSNTAYTSMNCTTFTCWCTQLPTSFYLNGKRNNQTITKISPKPSCHGNPWVSSISLAESPGASSVHSQRHLSPQTEFAEIVTPNFASAKWILLQHVTKAMQTSCNRWRSHGEFTGEHQWANKTKNTQRKAKGPKSCSATRVFAVLHCPQF